MNMESGKNQMTSVRPYLGSITKHYIMYTCFKSDKLMKLKIKNLWQ